MTAVHIQAHGRDAARQPGKSDHLVTFSLDGEDREIEKGKYLVSALKERYGIAADYELDLVTDGVFEPLPNDFELKIHGGEVLVSHVCRGGSS